MGLNTRRQFPTLITFTLYILASMFLGVMPLSAQGRGQGQKPETKTLIVKMARGLNLAQQQAVIHGHGGALKASIEKLDLQVIEVPAQAADAILATLQGDPLVLRVEEERQRRLQSTPSDNYYAQQWALPKIAWQDVFGVTMPVALTNVAILDTGIDGSHPDLVGNIGENTSIIPGANPLADANGHGTWLAGIVAARTNNIEGIAGVAYDNVQIMPVKVLGDDGLGTDSCIIQGVIWAADHGASVILMAFSNPGFSQSLQEAIDYAWSRNVVLVAAAGNDGTSSPAFPAGDKGVIGVSATDQNDELWPNSNFGKSVFLAAPGVDIAGTYKEQGYVMWSGTSASAAIVAGSAALMRAVDPSLTNGVVVNRMARTADPAGTQDQTGNGRVNLARALTDTNTDEIQPAGADPVGDGGPFVGPYRSAAGSLTLTPNTGLAGTVVAVTAGGNGFGKNLTITFTFNGSPISTTGSCVTNNGGNLVSGCSLTVPSLSAGPYTVAATDGTATLNATFTITGKLDQTISFGALADKTYGDADFTVSVTASSGLTVSFIASGNCTIAGTTVHLTGAGSCTVTAQQAGNGSYNPAPDVPQTFTIAKAASSTVVTVAGATYDGNTHGGTASVTGFGGLNQVLSVGYEGRNSTVYGPSATAPTNAGDYKASASFAGDADHDGSSDSKDFAIAAASSTTAVTCPASVIYDGLAQTPCTVSVTGAGGLNLTPAASYTDNVNVGVATASYTYAGDANHTGSNDSENFTIDPKSASVTPDAQSKIYGDADPLLTGTLDGFVPADGVTATYNRTAGESVLGSPYTISAALSPAGVLANYAITYNTADFTITSRLVTVTADAQSKIYGETDPALTYQIASGSLAFSDAFSGGLSRNAGEDVGSYAITQGSLALDSNYTLAYIGADLEITPRSLTVSAVGVNKVYDATTDATVSFTDNRLEGDLLTFGYVANFDDKNVGTGKPVSVNSIAISGGADSGNYSLSNTTSSTTADITSLAITGSITAEDKVYDATTAATIASRSLAGVLGSDDVSYVGGTATFDDKNVGDDKTVTATGLSLSGADAVNYTVNTTAMTTADISALGITGSITAADKVYDGTTAASITSRTLARVLGSDDVSYTGGTATFDNKNVGNDKAVTGAGLSLSGADAGNYTVNATANTTADITALGITGSFTAANKAYDGTTDATILTRSLSGVLEGDSGNVSMIGGTATFADPNVGTWTVTGTGFSLDGSEAGNYSLTSVADTTASISPAVTTATLTVTTPVQYSDQSTFTVTLSPDQILGVSPATGVQFKLDGTDIGAAQTLTDAGSNLTASLTTTIVVEPGTHTVTAVFSGVNSNFTVSAAIAVLTVSREDARATYTGLNYVTTASSSSSTATIILSTTIQDITAIMPAADAYPGDIRNAKVTFINRDTNTVIASNLPVSLVNAADTKTGTATYAWSVNIGNADSANVTVGVIVDNYYTRNDSADNTVITVKKPTAGSIGGGGHLINSGSAGLYAGTGGLKANFGLNVKFNKNGTNLQGNVNIIIRQADAGGTVHVYQIKSNSIDSLNITSPSSGVYKATFTSKANVTEITNPLAPVSLGGNKILQITMTDRGEPAALDSIGITLTDSGTGLLYTNTWNGITAVEQVLSGGSGGGNLQIRPN